MRGYLASIALLALSSNALAADPQLRGFYIGGGFGKANVELEDSESTLDFEGDDTGYKVIAGYRIIDWVAVEANYTHYGEPTDRLLGINLEAEFNSFSVSALGMLPLGAFDLFGRAGIARWEGELRATDFGISQGGDDNYDPLFGLGAQMRFGNVAIRAEWEALLLGFDDDDDDEADGDDWADMLSLGVTVRF